MRVCIARMKLISDNTGQTPGVHPLQHGNILNYSLTSLMT